MDIKPIHIALGLGALGLVYYATREEDDFDEESLLPARVAIGDYITATTREDLKKDVQLFEEGRILKSINAFAHEPESVRAAEAAAFGGLRLGVVLHDIEMAGGRVFIPKAALDDAPSALRYALVHKNNIASFKREHSDMVLLPAAV